MVASAGQNIQLQGHLINHSNEVEIASNQQFGNLTGSISTTHRSSNFQASAWTKAASRSSRGKTSGPCYISSKNEPTKMPTRQESIPNPTTTFRQNWQCRTSIAENCTLNNLPANSSEQALQNRYSKGTNP
ncbi:hypothetical protein Nepgr_014733 [Nepenthes gracilis]|uniref:Uncharacterized protein n=1 Tax=Nepenthes gracilis TaxID=150966 RepID=A0AAD3SKK3_NEPGR|nr:hypothetical protein Nepgr_014733 [Nepenthes gracilis]